MVGDNNIEYSSLVLNFTKQPSKFVMINFNGVHTILNKIPFFKKSVLLLLMLFVLVKPAFCQSYPYRFNYLTVDEGLSHTDANDIAQDKQGYIWIATYFGLDRFDGYEIKKFYNSNEPLNNAYKNRIVSICPDDNGNIWLSSEGGLQCFDSKTEKYIDYADKGNKGRSTFDKLIITHENVIYGLRNGQIKLYTAKNKEILEIRLKTPTGIFFSDMVSDKLGNLFLSSNNGLWMLSKDKLLRNIVIRGCRDLNLSRVYIDNQQNILVATNGQLFLTHRDASMSNSTNFAITVFKSYMCSPGRNIRCITADEKSNYWIDIARGILQLDHNLNPIQQVTNKSSINGLNSSSVSKIFIDRSQCLWVCTFGGGVNYCDLNEKQFYTFQHNSENANSISENYVRAILDDNGQHLWVGTTYNGLNLYDFKTQKFTCYNTYNSAIRLEKSDGIIALTLDNERNLWIGSNSGIEILAPDRRHLLKPAGFENFPRHAIDVLTKDCFGNIWFGNHTEKYGVIWKDKQNHFQVKYYGEGYFILSDPKKPELFVSSTHGLTRILIDKEGNISKSYHYEANGKPNSLSSNYTYPVCKQNDSTYWIGTIGGGLDRLIIKPDNSYTIKTYMGNVGVFNDVESMEIDNSGNIWMGGNGLEYLNPVTGKLIRFDKNDGLQGNSFKVGSSYKNINGRLYFGGINGLNYFDPANIKPNLIPAHPVLTDLLINNMKPNYGETDSTANALSQIISYSKSLTFNYLQNNFTISFSAMHYANPFKCKYRYKLTGYDKTWQFTDGKSPRVTYSNLDYGSYNFVVEATNNDGIWSTAQATIPIRVTPPWWKSTLAKIIYAALFISALIWIYVYQARWYRLKRDLAVREVNENKREEMHLQREELYQQQLQFFTNISHEFRTPLTLILGPLEGLINDNKNTALNNSYQLMFRNVRRLINLINELMNFKKVADSAIKLRVQRLAINDFCNSLYLEFQNFALSKNINLKIIDHTLSNTGQQTNYFDAQILEKILFNLLNNALKYTETGGNVTLEIFFDRNAFKPSFINEYHLVNDVYHADEYIYFLIADSGIGISKDSISSIFDRYYQIGKDHLGSGVGLALVKSLIQLHKGNISVYSERNKGTEFLIALPWGKNNFSPEEIGSPGSEPMASQLELSDVSLLTPLPDTEPDRQQFLPEKISKHILLVDDNHELRAFLRQSLEKFYYIYEAEDGESAITIATNKMPDLIISDVMMPGMNGIELCKLVKDKFETSHIPFVILSAKDALDTKIEGMESGADYYFAKPLSIDLLILTVHNIFQQSQKLKLKYSKDYLTDATELVHSEKDKDFINKLLQLIENNLQDANLDVDFICKHLYVSRTKLYQKIKNISDQSVGDFIKTIRLKKAIQIMTHEDIAFNEVAYRIGLQSHAYFSRVFKKEFGKSPSEFMQSLKRTQNNSEN
jgi:signal transduction histidine kinase/ligand-binding sensor domain-containing protein/DNA-binding response OmpR family regulator